MMHRSSSPAHPIDIAGSGEPFKACVRAIARQAEAERNRRARVIDAEGEFQAAEKLAQAGEILSNRPEAMQLRYYTALQTIAGEKSSTIVLPIPIELMRKIGAV